MTAPLTFIVLALAVLLLAGVWVGAALMSVGVLSLELFRSMRVDRFLAGDIWGTATAQELMTLPLFILMGEILFRTRLSDNLFSGLSPWVRALPGRLLHVNVLGCTLFAAVSGSSAATTATVGQITLKELESRGYDRMLSAGSLAGSGTMGFLIPPSIPLIVYGVLAEVSILDLFVAGIVPGLLLALLFMAYIAARAAINPALAPADHDTATWADRLVALTKLLPTVLLMLLVIGSMYLGFASVTEAAAIGVLGALVLTAWERQFTFGVIGAALMGTVKTCGLIGLIITGALFLSKAMARLRIPTDVAAAIDALQLTPMMLIVILLLFYLALGFFLDGLSTIVMTLPVMLPLVINAGFDPVWFGVFLIITIEMAQITPPIGFNLFVIHSLNGERIGRLALAAAPFCLLMIAFVILLVFVPELVLWLPSTLR